MTEKKHPVRSRQGRDHTVGRCAASYERGCCHPGPGSPRTQTERNQRERLFAAMAATVAEKGYAATTVADLLDLSGVSRSSYYDHFSDKQDCFLAAVEALLGPALEEVIDDAAAGRR